MKLSNKQDLFLVLASRAADPVAEFARLQKEGHEAELFSWVRRFRNKTRTISAGLVNEKTGEASDLENVRVQEISITWKGQKPSYEVLSTRGDEVFISSITKLSQIK